MATVDSNLSLSILNITNGQNISNTLFIENDSDTGDTLQMTLQNSGNAITLFSNSKGNANSAGYSFSLQFQPSIVNIDKNNVEVLVNTGGGWVSDTGDWDIQADLDTNNDSLILYFLYKSKSNPPALSTSKEIQVIIADVLTNTQTAVASNVELNISDSTQNAYLAQSYLNLVNHTGSQNNPFQVSVDAGRFLLNDGSTEHAISLSLYNMTEQAIELTNSTFQVTFEVGDDSFALTNNISSYIPENLSIFGLTIEHNDSTGNPVYEWPKDPGNPPSQILNPISAKTGNFLTIKTVENEGLITALPPGFAKLTINYSNVPGYWDGSIEIPLMRGGLVLKDSSVGIGTISPDSNAKLDVVGGIVSNAFLGFSGSHSPSTEYGVSVYSPAAQSIGFSTNSQERLRINEQGHVGIGTKTPNDVLEVQGGSIRVNNDPDNIPLSALSFYNGTTLLSQIGQTKTTKMFVANKQDGDLGFEINGTEHMTLTGSGSVGIGTSSPDYRLELQKNGNEYTTLEIKNRYGGSNQPPGNSGCRVLFSGYRDSANPWPIASIVGKKVNGDREDYLVNGGELHFCTNDGALPYDTGTDGMNGQSMNSRMMINKYGAVGIGTTSPAFPVHIKGSRDGQYAFIACIENDNNSPTSNSDGLLIKAGTTKYSGSDTQSGLITFFRPDNHYMGRIKQYGSYSINFYSNSDKRLKENLEATAFGLDQLIKIKIYDYNFIGDSKGDTHTGFIAQELYEIIPQVVGVGGNDPLTAPWDIAYAALTPFLVKAIQDLNEKAENLELQVKVIPDLNEKVENLELQVKAIQDLNTKVEDLQSQVKAIQDLNAKVEDIQSQIKVIPDLTAKMEDLESRIEAGGN